jgi:hypothetical protein
MGMCRSRRHLFQLSAIFLSDLHLQNIYKKMKIEDVDIVSTSLSNENYGRNVDKDVFDQLPTDIQNEIFQSQSTDNRGSFKTTTISAASLENNESKHTSDADSSYKGSNKCFEDEDLKGKLLKAGINVDDLIKHVLIYISPIVLIRQRC